MDAAALIDSSTPEPVLVVGSPPPTGRDLDLLVRPRAEAVLTDLLAASGFHRIGRTWARFRDCQADVVELIPADSLGLGEAQLGELFAQAQPLDGSTSLLHPAAHHRLLLFARRAAAEARLKPKQRLAAAQLDGEAWRLAGRLAPAWEAGAALTQLERALSDRPPRSWHVRSALVRAARYRPGAVIALSGLDGSGKSTQADSLAQSLSKLGYRTVAVWTSFGANPSLARVTRRIRALLDPGTRGAPRATHPPPAGEDDDRVTRLLERLPLLQSVWVSVVAVMNGWWQLRAVWPHLLAGRVVICDRYALDSLVHMRYRYGSSRRYRAQLALIRLLSPTPLRAYLLDVSPATVQSRNREYTHRQTEIRARLYEEEHARLGVIRVDGERAKQDVCAQLALETWKALSARSDRRRPLVAQAAAAAGRGLARR